MKVIRINQLKLPVGHSSEALEKAVRLAASMLKDEHFPWQVVRRSIDARFNGTGGIYYCYTIDVDVDEEHFKRVLRRCRNKKFVSEAERVTYSFPVKDVPEGPSPVIVGFGPAGIFAALVMAEAGMKPIVIEQGDDAETRSARVEEYWQGGPLDVRSNVQFGEGGAGAFSDGKLNSNVKDVTGRLRYVLQTLVDHGADPDILIDAMPHVGTDRLREIIPSIRRRIISLGGEVHFRERMTSLIMREGTVCGIVTDKAEYMTDAVILAIGHSSRETYERLHEQGIPMEAKAFACGYRIQHQQFIINLRMYGRNAPPELGAAPYKLTYNSRETGRGVYSFCMCPGGYVVDSSSEEGGICVNGMSYSDRAGENANSAIVITVTPEDYGGEGPLAGLEFQRRIEQAAYRSGGGAIPVQKLGDFIRGEVTETLGSVRPQIKGQWRFANLRGILPEELEQDIIDAIDYFGFCIIPFFAADDTLLAGVEARTSSPVRIPRNGSGQSVSARGLFPAGEGAGYAGGIVSAAIDGIKAAEQAALARAAAKE